jgi:hypothetical protein
MACGSHVGWSLEYSHLLITIGTGVVDIAMEQIPYLGGIFSELGSCIL